MKNFFLICMLTLSGLALAMRDDLAPHGRNHIFNQFPQEIWLIIFSHLDNFDQIKLLDKKLNTFC